MNKLLGYIKGGWIISRLYNELEGEVKDRLNADMEAYGEEASACGCMRLMQENGTKKSFRNVFYFRLAQDSRLIRLCRRKYPPVDSIEIAGDIGGGLKILHSYCVINLKKAGRDLHVCQGCTIGKGKDGEKPSFGNNVLLHPNSVVFGPITVEDNVIIGAGSIVNKDVPANAVVAGNPFRILNTDSLK